ncbi:MAG: hypothetical protein IIB56_18690, partial [Planctomycetes bacterium]|nr:hypothetical protein [Planctomycetota bacterium]
MVGVQKRKILWAISLLLVMLYFSGLTAQAQYGGGSGGPNDPYLIYTAEQMNAIGADANDWDKHFILMEDIDLSVYTGKDFNIIGYYVSYDSPDNNPFIGVFDGNGHTISNFNYTSDVHRIGLFGYVEGENAEIKDLVLIDTNVDAGGDSYVGSMVGELRDGTITGCYAEGGSVSGNENVGGLVGSLNKGTITNCNATGNVSGNRKVGGLVGYNYVSTITNCYATGSVSGLSKVGGLVGYNRRGSISSSYSTGMVNLEYNVGGLVGLDDEEGRIITASFWDIETSGRATSAGGTGLTTAQMQDINTFLNAGWDFVDEAKNGTEDIWWILEGWDYPRLYWEPIKDGQTRANVYYVDAVSGDNSNDGLTPEAAFTTIQKSINMAGDGSVVLVYPGLYQEEINFLGKKLIVQGVVKSPAGVPVLQNPGDFAVSFYYGEGPDSTLNNFIIRDSFMGVFIAGSSPTISNLTIVGNKYGIEAYAGSEPDISNIILWNNTDGDLFGCEARYSCIERGGEGEGNITVDPLFVDPDNGDYHLRSERGRYWPEHDIWVLDKVTSPCVDGGNPNVDPLDEPVPNGNRIDIGAYGGTPEASLSPSGQPCPLPGQASNPNPAHLSGVSTRVELSWTAGLNTISHDVYFGTSDPPPFIRNQTETEFDPGSLDLGTTYYWRIDEVNSSGKTSGPVWTFTYIPPPKSRACFTGDTGVWVDGALVQISNVVSGQMVGGPHCDLATDCLEQIETVEEHEGTFECRDIVLESGNRISVVDAHCFMLDSGQWIAAQDLRSGLRLKTLSGTVGIKSVA